MKTTDIRKLNIRKLNIRKCGEEDIVRVGQFYDDIVLWLDDHINYPLWRYNIYPSESNVRAMTGAGEQYVCTDGGTILAAFALSTGPGLHMVLKALAIAPQKQRQGIGSEIIRFCIDEAKAENYKAILAEVVPTNRPARRLFEKNGFVYTGEADSGLDFEDIPVFSLYELNF